MDDYVDGQRLKNTLSPLRKATDKAVINNRKTKRPPQTHQHRQTERNEESLERQGFLEWSCPGAIAKLGQSPLQMANHSLGSLSWRLWSCEGGGDVVGVVTPHVGGEAQAFHDDQVVELRVQLGVQEVEGKEEDREGQVEVEEERRLKEVRTWMTMEMFKTRLRSWANEVWDTSTSARYVRAQRMMCTTQASVWTSSLVYLLCFVSCM